MMKRHRETSLQPVNVGSSADNFHLRSPFVQQGTRFERTLATSDYEHLFSCENP